MRKIVMKFGGAPLANGENIRYAANIIANYACRGHRIVAVVSALKGVTDELLKVAEKAKKGDKEYVNEFTYRISKKHFAAAEENIKKENLLSDVKQILKRTIRELDKTLTGIVYIGELTPKIERLCFIFWRKTVNAYALGNFNGYGTQRPVLHWRRSGNRD
jgi:aspartokinase